MNTFPGATRRIYIRLEHGSKVHLLKRRSKRTGSQTWCGHSGTEIGWHDAKDYELCSVCGMASGLLDRVSA